MNAPSSNTERRQFERYPLVTGLHFYHGPSECNVPARSQNISAGGVLVSVPVTARIRVGHPIRMNTGLIHRPELVGPGRHYVAGTIVRVDHDTLRATGELGVGIRFAAA